jgi:hypothetical protein
MSKSRRAKSAKSAKSPVVSDGSNWLEPLRLPESRVYRWKRVLISCRVLHLMVTQDTTSDAVRFGSRCTEGLPPDARLPSCGLGAIGEEPMLAMVFEHPSWPEIAED